MAVAGTEAWVVGKQLVTLGLPEESLHVLQSEAISVPLLEKSGGSALLERLRWKRYHLQHCWPDRAKGFTPL